MSQIGHFQPGILRTATHFAVGHKETYAVQRKLPTRSARRQRRIVQLARRGAHAGSEIAEFGSRLKRPNMCETFLCCSSPVPRNAWISRSMRCIGLSIALLKLSANSESTARIRIATD